MKETAPFAFNRHKLLCMAEVINHSPNFQEYSIDQTKGYDHWTNMNFEPLTEWFLFYNVEASWLGAISDYLVIATTLNGVSEDHGPPNRWSGTVWLDD